MICFRDMTFCKSDCINKRCDRHFGHEDKRAAAKWWGGEDAPVAFCDFHATCPVYEAPEEPDDAT